MNRKVAVWPPRLNGGVRSRHMTKNDARALLISSLVWIVLYCVTLYSVSWLLRHDLSRLYSAIPSSLGYFVPGFLVTYLAKRKTLFLGIVIGTGGSAVWLLHSGLYAALGRHRHYVMLTFLGNILMAVAGAYVARRWFSVRHIRA